MTPDINTIKKPNYLQLAQRFAFIILKRWYIVALCVCIGVAVSFFVNRYSRSTYQLSASLLYTVPVTKERGMDETAMMMKQMLIERSSLELIRSRANFSQTFDSLDFYVSYQAEGNIMTTDLYPNKPFIVEYDTTQQVPSNVTFILSAKGKGFALITENAAWSVFLPEDKEYFFEVPYTINGFQFTISRSEQISLKYKYYFTLYDKASLVDEYRNRLQVTHDTKTSLYYLSLTTSVPQKDAKFINTFAKVFIQNAKKQKYESAIQSLNFIDNQMKSLTDSLFAINKLIGELKLSNVYASSGVNYVVRMVDSLDQMKRSNNRQQKQRDFVRKYIETRYDSSVFSPPNINLNNQFYNNYVGLYSDYVLSKKKAPSEESKDNPLIAKRDSAHLKLERSINDVFNTASSYEALLEQIQEKDVTGLMDKMPIIQEINDKINQLQWTADQIADGLKQLLEKRTEAQLMIAQTTSDYKVYDEPTKYFVPVSPNRSKNKSLGLFLGLLIPIAFIVIRELLHPYIKYKQEITTALTYPVVGLVSHSDFAVEGKHVVVADCPRTQVSESLRAVRAALMYILGSEIKTTSHVILVSSSVSGEGKSMVSSNLAALYAMAGKKTLLIDADMRRPTIRKIFRIHDSKSGLSNVLIDTVSAKEAIHKSEIKNLDILCAGALPPNPFELLSSSAMSDLLIRLKQDYEYILIDTPPVLLVSDARPLMQLSDVNVLVVRFNKTLKSSLVEIKDIMDQDNTQNIALVFNDVQAEYARYSGQYGRGYGRNSEYNEYYTDQERPKPRFFKFPWS